MRVDFKNMRASVPIDITGNAAQKGETKVILNGVSGSIPPGKLVALMGPSGAGKSTLLNVLGSRFHGECSGSVLINNCERSKRFKKHVGYVLQYDKLLPNLTVRETLRITANLRLPGSLSAEDKARRVDDIIAAMGLSKCQHTMVQSVSGGESKRVSIANELLINPSILYLDEPTSGPDSTSALSILTTLRELCRQGRTVICAIHQPSSQMFAMFDLLMLLASANVVYFGSAADVCAYFDALGHECPARYNPADFILELVTDNFGSGDDNLAEKEQIKKRLTTEWKNFTERNNTLVFHQQKHEAEEVELDVPAAVDDYHIEADFVPPEEDDSSNGSRWMTTWLEQFCILYIRAFKHRRGHLWSKIRAIEVFGIAFLGGCVWFQIAHTEENIQDYVAASFFIGAYLMFSVMYRGVVHFPLEREVIKKERQSGAYRLSAYFVSKFLAEFPVDILFPVLSCSLFFWLVGLANDFTTYVWFMATMCIVLLCANSFGIMCGCTVANFEHAITMLAVFGLFMMALSGFMIKDRSIPEWIRWMKYASFMRYGYLGGLHTTLQFVSFECSSPSSIYDECVDGDRIPGDVILGEFGVTEPYWLCVALMFALMSLWFTIAYINLRRVTSIKG